MMERSGNARKDGDPIASSSSSLNRNKIPGTNNNRSNLNNFSRNGATADHHFGDRSRPTNGSSLPPSSPEEAEHNRHNHNAPLSLLHTQKLDNFLDRFEHQYQLTPLSERDVQDSLESLMSLIEERNSSYEEIARILGDMGKIGNLTYGKPISSLDSQSQSSRSPLNNNINLTNRNNNGKVAASANSLIRDEDEDWDFEEDFDCDSILSGRKDDTSTEEFGSWYIIKDLKECSEPIPEKVNSNSAKSSEIQTTVSILNYANKGKSQEVNANKTVQAPVNDNIIQLQNQPTSKNITASWSWSKKDSSKRINTEVDKLSDAQTSEGKISSVTPPQRRPQHIDNSKNAVRKRDTSQEMRECARKLVTNRTFVKEASSEKSPSSPPTQPPPQPISILKSPYTKPAVTKLSSSVSAGSRRSGKGLAMKSKIPVPLPKTKSQPVNEAGVKATETSCNKIPIPIPISSSAGVVNTSKTLKETGRSLILSPASNNSPSSASTQQQVEMKTDGKSEKVEKSFEHLNPKKSRVLHLHDALIPKRKREIGSGDEISQTLDLIDGLSGHTSWVMKKLLEYPKSEQDLRGRLAKFLKQVPDIGEFFGAPYIQKEAQGHYFFGKANNLPTPSSVLRRRRL